MGIVNGILGIGNVVEKVGAVVKNTGEVFHVNQTEAMKQNALRFTGAQAQFASEFEKKQVQGFGNFVNALNRLPRPLLAFGTIGLFAYAMVDPRGFTIRMEGLNYVPEPMWWLLGAIVGFYFGARELHHYRNPVQNYQRIQKQAKDIGQRLNKPDQKERVLDKMITNNQNIIDKTKINTNNSAILAWLDNI